MNTRSDSDQARQQRIWKLVSMGTGMLSAFLAKRLLRGVYRSIRKADPGAAFDPTSERFSWPNALLWTVAAGIGLAAARMVSQRVAAIGWKAATGTLPPGTNEPAVG